MTIQSLKKYRRITVKIGSALLVDRATGLKRDWLASLADDIAALAPMAALRSSSSRPAPSRLAAPSSASASGR